MIKFFVLSFLLFISLHAKEFFYTDYKEALSKAQKESKFVYVLVTSKHCSWCKKFYNQTLSDKEVQEILKKNFISLKLLKEKNSIKKFKSPLVPAHFFLKSDGTISFQDLGYINSKEFRKKLIDFIKENR